MEGINELELRRMINVLNFEKIAEMFASLHNHSHYSLLDSTMSPKEIVQQAHQLGYKAVAITEHGNMHSVIEGYKEAQELGIKYIVGCEVYETTDMKWKDAGSDRYHLLLLAKDNKGYENLLKLVSEGATRGFYGKPRIDLETIAHYSEGLIATSACLASRLMRLLVKGFCPCCGLGNDQHKEDCSDESVFVPKWDEAIKEVEKYKSVFKSDFYIELQSHGTHDQMIGNQRILELAKMTDTKTIITFDAHMKDGSEKTRDIHRKFVKISQNSREVGETYMDCYQQDMKTMYKILAPQIGIEAINEAVKNTGEIADKCNVTIELHQDLMPHIPVPKKFKNEVEYMKHLLNRGWKERGIHKKPKEVQKIYAERLHKEIEVLEYLGFCSYFIMNKMLLDKIKERKIPKGYSRGSGANSLCFYLLGVTEVDSIEYGLDFSRFANKGRKGSLADYDIDISKRRRGEVLEIVEELFGEENVAHICTFNSLSTKVAIRDLGKVFDEEKIYSIPYAIRDKIAKLVPDDTNISVALEKSGELRKWQAKYPLLFEYVEAIENKPKSVGCHASAIAVSSKPITQVSAVMLNKDGRHMLHLEMHNAQDDLGLVKLDILGLSNVDTVADTLSLAGLTEDDIDLRYLDLKDQDVYREIYGKGSTVGIFQMESYVAQNMLKQMQPDNINDIFAVNAMNRPAVLSVGMDKLYIHYKHNPSAIKYLHEDLRPIMEETNSIMIYQEQALKVFGLAGFSEDEQDTARRAIGKKIKEVMDSLYEQFKEGLHRRKWKEKTIFDMWELIRVQSEYSFNKGHSSSYGLLSYVTAYLKYHHPVEFMTALLISAIGDYEDTSKYITECNRMGIKVKPPQINKSNAHYSVAQDKDGKAILFGLESIKGVGAKAVELILEERSKGKFKSLQDFLERCKVDSTTTISLIKAGAFGSRKDEMLEFYANFTFKESVFKPVKTIPTKKILMEYGLISTDEEFKDKELCLDRYNEYRLRGHMETQEKKLDKHMTEFRRKYMKDPDMYEFVTLSIFLNGNPFDGYIEYFNPFTEYEDGMEKVLIGGTITSIERKKQKSGGTYAYIEVLMYNGEMYEGMVFNKQFVEYAELVAKGSNIVCLVKKSGEQFIVSKMKSFDNWRIEMDNKRTRKGA